MGYYNKDVVHDAEHFGLEYVGRIELENQMWQFDMLAVLYNPERKNFYIVRDSGCSCPSPWERHTTLTSLGEARSAHDTVARINSVVAEYRASGYGRPDDPSDLIAAIMRR